MGKDKMTPQQYYAVNAFANPKEYTKNVVKKYTNSSGTFDTKRWEKDHMPVQKYYATKAFANPKQYIKDKYEGYIDKNGNVDVEQYNKDIDWQTKSEWEKENKIQHTEKRGMLSRIFGMLGYGGIVEGLYNLTDNDDSTTFTQGLKEGLNNMNPFNDDVSKQNTFSDVLRNLGWEDKKDGSANIGRGIVGFIGDVLADPLTYLNPYSSAAKIVKGTGVTLKGTKALKASEDALNMANKIDDAVKNPVSSKIDKLYNITIDDAKDIIRKNQSVQLTEKEIEDKATELLGGYAQHIKGFRDSNQGSGFSVGLGGVIPFSNKIKIGNKSLDSFSKTLISSEKLRSFGDKTIAPYYNSLVNGIRASKLGSLSFNNLVYKISELSNDKMAFGIYALKDMLKETDKSKANLKDIGVSDFINKIFENATEEDEIRFIQDYDSGKFERLKELEKIKLSLKDMLSKSKETKIKELNNSSIKNSNNLNDKIKSLDSDLTFEKISKDIDDAYYSVKSSENSDAIQSKSEFLEELYSGISDTYENMISKYASRKLSHIDELIEGIKNDIDAAKVSRQEFIDWDKSFRETVEKTNSVKSEFDSAIEKGKALLESDKYDRVLSSPNAIKPMSDVVSSDNVNTAVSEIYKDSLFSNISHDSVGKTSKDDYKIADLFGDTSESFKDKKYYYGNLLDEEAIHKRNLLYAKESGLEDVDILKRFPIGTYQKKHHGNQNKYGDEYKHYLKYSKIYIKKSNKESFLQYLNQQLDGYEFDKFVYSKDYKLYKKSIDDKRFIELYNSAVTKDWDNFFKQFEDIILNQIERSFKKYKIVSGQVSDHDSLKKIKLYRDRAKNLGFNKVAQKKYVSVMLNKHFQNEAKNLGFNDVAQQIYANKKIANLKNPPNVKTVKSTRNFVSAEKQAPINHKLDEKYDARNSDTFSEVENLGVERRANYEIAQALSQKYFKEAYKMYGKTLDNLSFDETMEFYENFSLLDKWFPLGNIDYGELFCYYYVKNININNLSHVFGSKNKSDIINYLLKNLRDNISEKGYSSHEYYKNKFLSLPSELRSEMFNNFKNLMNNKWFETKHYKDYFSMLGKDDNYIQNFFSNKNKNFSNKNKNFSNKDKNIVHKSESKSIANNVTNSDDFAYSFLHSYMSSMPYDEYETAFVMKADKLAELIEEKRASYDFICNELEKLREFGSKLDYKHSNNKFINSLQRKLDNLYKFKEKHAVAKIEYNNKIADAQNTATDEILELERHNAKIMSKKISSDEKIKSLTKNISDLTADRKYYYYKHQNYILNEINRVEKNLTTLEKASGKSMIDDMYFYAHDDVSKSIKLANEELKFLDDVENSNYTYTLLNIFNKRMSEIAEKEVAIGKLSTEQADSLSGHYFQRLISEEAKKLMNMDSFKFIRDSGKFNPSAHGFKSSNNKNRVFKTMAEGEEWWVECNKKAMFNEAKAKGMSDVEANNFVKDNFNPDSICKLYKYNLAEMYLTRSLSSNEILHSHSTNNFIKSLCTKYNGIKSDDHVVVSYIDLFNNLSKKYNTSEALQSKYFSFDDYIEYVISEAGINKQLFSSNFAYFDVSDEQIRVLNEYSKNPNTAYNMNHLIYNMVNTLTYEQKKILQSDFITLFDKFQSNWKLLNTVINPGFHIQNAVSNAFQSFLVCGVDAFNPKSIKLAFNVLRTGDPKQKVKIGEEFLTYKNLKDLAEQYKVLDNTFFKKDVTEKIYDFPLYKFGTKVGTEIEGIGRMNLFISLLKQGKSPKEASEGVDKFLFDYSDLTYFEKNILRRIIPFYTFMRKNIPMELEQMLLNPQLFSGIEKAKNEIEDMSSEPIDENERNPYRQGDIQIPFQINGDNYSITDNLPYSQLERVLSPQKLLGQITPAIKTPIEALTNTYLYTGMPIKEEGQSNISAILNYLSQQAPYSKMAVNSQTKENDTAKALYIAGQLGGFPINPLKKMYWYKDYGNWAKNYYDKNLIENIVSNKKY